MIKIAICDDEKHFRILIKEYIQKYMGRKNLECEIDLFVSGKEFVDLGLDIVQYNNVFLDINMDELDGIKTAQKIREVSNAIFLVFVTAYVNYALEGYRVDAVRYLLKDSTNFENAMNECLDTIIEKMNYNIIQKRFSFIEGNKDVLLERILYIESRLHKLEFYILGQKIEKYTLYETLNEMETLLAKYNFVRIHQSFLINLKHLHKVSSYKAILTNGFEFVIPKARYKVVKDAFIAFKGEL